MRFFISYRRRDSEFQAWGLAEALRELVGSESVFLDVEGIRAGQDFRGRIEDEVRTSDCVIALIGPTWTDPAAGEEDFVHIELDLAFSHGRLVVPVLHSGTPMPDRRAMPEHLGWLAYRQAVEVRRPDQVRSVANVLIERTQQHLDEVAASSPAPTGRDELGADVPAADRRGADGIVQDPVVVIGCGGTPVRELMRLRQRLVDVSPGTRSGPPPWWRFVSIDLPAVPELVDGPGLPATDHLGISPPLPIGLREVFDRLRRDRPHDVDGWLPDELDNIAVAFGAGNQRNVGRAVVLAAEDLVRAFIADHVRAAAASAPASDPASTVTVVVVASLAGGTGGGIWFDVCRVASELDGVGEVLPVLLPLSGLDIFTSGGTDNFFAAYSEMLGPTRGQVTNVLPPLLVPDPGVDSDERDAIRVHEVLENLLVSSAAWRALLTTLGVRRDDGRRGWIVPHVVGASALAVAAPRGGHLWQTADSVAVAVEDAIGQVAGRSVRPSPEQPGLLLLVECPARLAEEFTVHLDDPGLVNPRIVRVPERRSGQVRVMAVAPPSPSVARVRWIADVFGAKWRRSRSAPPESRGNRSRRACLMRDFIPVTESDLRAMVHGWVVGRLFGVVVGDPASSGFAISRLGNDRLPEVLPFPWPFLDARLGGPDDALWMTGVLESFVVADLLQATWPEIRQSYDALRELGGVADELLREWIRSGLVPAASVTTSEFLGRVEGRANDPSDRRSALAAAINAVGVAQASFNTPSIPDRGVGLDTDWLRWCAERIAELLALIDEL